MVAEIVLTLLLWIALVLAVALILIAAATVGRKAADLEYQIESGINGVRRIQSWINLRTHLNRVFLGVTFVGITVLLLADAPLEVRTWVNRILFALLMASYVISSVQDWVDERKQVQILQTQAGQRQERAVAAGVKGAEDRAEAKADALALTQAAEATMDSVDVATIQPEAVGAIVDAIETGQKP